jgi:hypothetical protein
MQKTPPMSVTNAVSKRQLEVLLSTARNSGRTFSADAIVQEPILPKEIGVMRFFRSTYGFILRQKLVAPFQRTSVEDSIAGDSSSASLFVGKDDLRKGVPDPDRGQLVIYGLLPPGDRLVNYQGGLYRPHSAKLKAISVEPASLILAADLSELEAAALPASERVAIAPEEGLPPGTLAVAKRLLPARLRGAASSHDPRGLLASRRGSLEGSDPTSVHTTPDRGAARPPYGHRKLQHCAYFILRRPRAHPRQVLPHLTPR